MPKEIGFLNSELTLDNQFQSMADFLNWFESRKKANKFVVEKIPLSKMDKWFFDHKTKNIMHESGKFFKIKGIKVLTNDKAWEQPIIDQPEIGVLGIITKQFNGIRYFLMQAKMEPGNINFIQLAPTIQATKSNYTQAHKGDAPKYLEYFVDKSKYKILVDCLQTENGGRFFRKRNRNIIIEVEDDIPAHEDFKWLTLGEIKRLIQKDNFVNMDARSVISCINFSDQDVDDEFINKIERGFKRDVFISMVEKEKSIHSMDDILHWFTEMKSNSEMNVETIALKNVKNWIIDYDEIRHEERNFFNIIGVSVQAGNREIGKWDQPLVKHNSYAFIGFLAKRINGILHFLIQAKAEPGSFTLVEMAPTVECSNVEERIKKGTQPKFLDIFMNAPKDKIRYMHFHSDEGGRFYQSENKCVIVETDENIEIPENYKWMTLNQITNLIKHNYFNISGRSLISYLSLK